jgi:hypothetical protein
MEDGEEPFTLLAAWEQVKVLLGFITALFGAPGALAAQLYLRAATRLEILQWLAPLEALARRLLAIEALALPPPNMPPPRTRLRDAPVDGALREPALPAAAAADPETWRVVFNLWPGARAGAHTPARAHTAAPEGDPPLLRNALSLARRIEALRRLAEAPEHALRRMAALLAARRAEAAARFTNYAPRKRLRACPAASLLEAAQAHLCAALAGDTS